MKIKMKTTAIVTTVALIIASPGFASAAGQDDRRHRKSKTEKVLTSLAVGAIAGLTYYALTRNNGHRQDRYNSRRYNRRPSRSYIAFNIGFRSYSVGSPYSRSYYSSPRGYWSDVAGQRFYRIPYRYNSHHDRGFNSGWERGYWAGFLQGTSDYRQRQPYFDRFECEQNYLWGYAPACGQYSSYQGAFHRAFSAGYSHGFNRNSYGHDGFGYGVSYRNRW